MRASFSVSKPSSITKAQLKYFGTPPQTATSLTVPQTASLPTSPPGKKSGETTKLSVEKTSFSAPARIAPSSNASSALLEKAGSSIFSISREVFFPPLP